MEKKKYWVMEVFWKEKKNFVKGEKINGIYKLDYLRVDISSL